MSGLLRRIKRSRTADAGEAPAEGQAAAPEGAPTTAETSGGDASSARTSELPVTAPAIHADPHTPAGLDTAEAAAAPTGRRGRLRRRLRYLRRARELMLRDLGGLLYEVHRTGGGDVAAHSGVIRPKVERLSSLDAEAAAIESALGAPRAEDVVFQPGVGGTCGFCGELYGSAARYCSNCGSPTGSAVRATPAPLVEPRPVPRMPKPPAEAEKKAEEPAEKAGEPAAEKADELGVEKKAEEPAEEKADELAAVKKTELPAAKAGEPAAAKADEPAAKADEPAAEKAKKPTKKADEPAPAKADEPAAAPDGPNAPGGDAAPGEARSLSNGRSEGGSPPEPSSGDPLATRESRP
jgi:hypothetical protein